MPPLGTVPGMRADSCRMSGVCETWALDDLVRMDEGDMDRLLAHYESGSIPSFADIRIDTQPEIS